MMFVLTLLISRAVPLLFVFAALLVVGRLLYDRYRPSHPLFAKGIFSGVLLLGLLATTPFMLRSGALVAAEFWTSLNGWEKADQFFGLYYRLGGPSHDQWSRDWASSRMNLERWAEAEEVLLQSVVIENGQPVTTPYTIYLLGICRYYQGRWRAAERTLSAVDDSEFFFLRSYFLGRLAERDGNPERALELYRRCLKLKPDLLAALYQSVRLLLDRGQLKEAARLVDDFVAAAGAIAEDPLVDELKRAVSGAAADLPDVEFRLVQIQG